MALCHGQGFQVFEYATSVVEEPCGWAGLLRHLVITSCSIPGEHFEYLGILEGYKRRFWG